MHKRSLRPKQDAAREGALPLIFLLQHFVTKSGNQWRSSRTVCGAVLFHDSKGSGPQPFSILIFLSKWRRSDQNL